MAYFIKQTQTGINTWLHYNRAPLPQISVQCQIYDFQALDKASLNDVYKLAIFNDQSFNTQAVETEVREQGYVFFEANLVNSESRAVI